MIANFIKNYVCVCACVESCLNKNPYAAKHHIAHTSTHARSFSGQAAVTGNNYINAGCGIGSHLVIIA